MERGATIKNPKELELIRQGGKRLAKILERLCKMVKPGVTTEELDVAAERMIREAGGEPAFKGYAPRPDHPPFTTTICACLNQEVVHAPAVPSRVIKDGDLVKIDIGMRWPVLRTPSHSPSERGRNETISSPLQGEVRRGLYTDTARTVMVGRVDRKVRELIKVTGRALKIGIKQVRAGHRVSHISKAIEKYVEKFGFGIVRELVGHGVGYRVHEPPEIPNFWVEGFPDCILQEGMVIAIEPMVNLGTWRVNVQPDGWTIVTADGKPSAHFEHTVIVRKRGAEVVT
ncbi:methionyl aminopeptidase [Candidatus Uhrbacteria bacterium]|nr:methionyl aminopeptidase [Candidatus Uhrbacteria bacterium]